MLGKQKFTHCCRWLRSHSWPRLSLNPGRLAWAIFSITLALALLNGRVSLAGGGPENVFLVVNSADMASLTIANHFAEWRQVPPGNVFEIDWPDAPFTIDMKTFRERLLGPILEQIKKRKLTDQIDYIVYSSGFPFSVQFWADMGKTKPDRNDTGSITGLTYLHDKVMRGDRSYAQAVNVYARNVLSQFKSTGTQGFRSRYGFTPSGKRISTNGGNQFYLSMMLGYTTGKENNSLAEILRYLSSGAKADGTQPPGTIYFVTTNNVRSTVRQDFFPEVVEDLIAEGVRAEVIKGADTQKDCLPVGKPDVAGAMIGFYKFSWPATRSKMVPGAICEHFTSWGGELTGAHTAQQSLLCEFLRYGAVAASGTVTEPYASVGPGGWKNPKFPHPRLHLHYARGCSVAEAFYQAVLAPYQLIIVGDPLCQPWAVAPEVTISGLNTQEAISGVQELDVTAASQSGYSIRNYDVFIDGVKLLQALPGKPIRLDTTKLNNGYHELRVVAVEESRIETQGRATARFVSINGETSPEEGLPNGVTSKVVPENRKIRANGAATVELQSRGARELRLYKGRKLLGTIPGESGQIRVSARELGGGISTLTPVALPKAARAKPMFGFPIEVKVQFGF